MIFYTIFDTQKGKYWKAISDMNSTERWGEGFFFWLDRKLAEECLAHHKEGDEYNEYKYSYVVEIKMNDMLFTNYSEEIK